MSNTAKLIIPLLDKDFKKEDFTDETGFVDGYVEDINKPSLTNHTFLVFDGNLDTEKKLERDAKMRHCSTLYSRRTAYISGNPYLIYTFINLSKAIERIRDNKMPYDEENYLRIMRFWNFEDDYVNSFLRNPSKRVDDGLVVPEEDYTQEWGDEFDINT